MVFLATHQACRAVGLGSQNSAFRNQKGGAIFSTEIRRFADAFAALRAVRRLAEHSLEGRRSKLDAQAAIVGRTTQSDRLGSGNQRRRVALSPLHCSSGGHRRRPNGTGNRPRKGAPIHAARRSHSGKTVQGGSLAPDFEFRCRTAGNTFEIVCKTPRQGRIPVVSTEFEICLRHLFRKFS